MGLWERVRRARLAGQVIRRLHRSGRSDARYDARGFRVRFTADGHETILELAPLLAERRGRRREQVDRFVAGLVTTPRVPRAWAEARPLLRPVLRGGAPGASLRRPVLPFLYEFVVVDQPDTMTYVGPDQPVVWGVSAEEVFEAARANLSGAMLHGVASDPVVVRFVDDGDAYWTSHLLLRHWLARLAGQVGGRPVAFAPERGTLLVTADGSEYLSGLFAQAEEVYAKSARPITPMAYVSDEQGCTVPYAAPPGYPLHRAVQRAERLLAVHEYARQAAQHDPAQATRTALDHAQSDHALSDQAEGDRALSDGMEGDHAQSDRTEGDHALSDQAEGDHAQSDRTEGDHAQSDHAEDTRAHGRAQNDHVEGDHEHGEHATDDRTGGGHAVGRAAAAAMAELRLVGSDEEGWRTLAVWERDEPVLLPAADEVQIGSVVRPWADVRPHLRLVADQSPPRWSAAAWPPG